MAYHSNQHYHQDPNAHYPQDQVNTFGTEYDQSQYQTEYHEGQDDGSQYYYDETGQLVYVDPQTNQSYYVDQQQFDNTYNNNQQYQQHPQASHHQNANPPLPSKPSQPSAPPLPGRGAPSARGGPAPRGGPPGRGPRGAPPPRRAPKKSGGILGFVNKGIDATMKTASKTSQQIATASSGKPTDEGAKRWEEAALGERLSAEFPAKLLTHNKAMQGSVCVSPSWFAFLPTAKQNPNVILSWMDIDRIIENHKSKQKGNYAPVFTAQEKTDKKVNAFIVTTFSGASYQIYGFKMAYKTAIGSVTGTMSTAKRRGGAPAPVPAPLPNKTMAPHPVKQAPAFPSRGNSQSNPPLPSKSGAAPPLPSKGGNQSPVQQPYYPPQNYDQSHNYQPQAQGYDQYHQQGGYDYNQQNYSQSAPYQTGHFPNAAAPPLSPPGQQQQYGHAPQLPPHNPQYSHPPTHNPSYPPQQFNPPPLPPKR
eukprot:TRINITY_DN112_c3_g1_i2.p1 TRINITY_DN112_c3_g1~~TRINITY_DN112_c3_g1_i2.p1  ORF type:complete len:475 (+),score=172.57 TRINITY_DN112_c3_g1_i2:115-1539(+)